MLRVILVYSFIFKNPFVTIVSYLLLRSYFYFVLCLYFVLFIISLFIFILLFFFWAQGPLKPKAMPILQANDLPTTIDQLHPKHRPNSKLPRTKLLKPSTNGLAVCMASLHGPLSTHPASLSSRANFFPSFPFSRANTSLQSNGLHRRFSLTFSQHNTTRRPCRRSPSFMLHPYTPGSPSAHLRRPLLLSHLHRALLTSPFVEACTAFENHAPAPHQLTAYVQHCPYL